MNETLIAALILSLSALVAASIVVVVAVRSLAGSNDKLLSTNSLLTAEVRKAKDPDLAKDEILLEREKLATRVAELEAEKHRTYTVNSRTNHHTPTEDEVMSAEERMILDNGPD